MLVIVISPDTRVLLLIYVNQPFKDEAQAASFKDPVRTAL
jgi:hypothetical protein